MTGNTLLNFREKKLLKIDKLNLNHFPFITVECKGIGH